MVLSIVSLYTCLSNDFNRLKVALLVVAQEQVVVVVAQALVGAAVP